jgi:asparaginyl-tRNA synthetase
MLRLRHATLQTLHTYFEVCLLLRIEAVINAVSNKNEGFCYVHTPILTSNDCEGAGEAFRIAPQAQSLNPPDPMKSDVEFFSHPSYLTVSSQLHLEALASAISRVYTLSPCFRAEPSLTSRHLAEFWMLEAEWAFTQCVEDVCRVVEAAIKDTLRRTASNGRNSDDVMSKTLEDAGRADRSWARITYTDAVRELSKNGQGFESAPKWGMALRSDHERWLAEQLIGGPVFVTDYPVSLKPFYMRLNDDGQTVGCFDLLVPRVGELVGGSLREERLPMLKESLERHELGESEYGWYLELRKFGGTPHGGFGMGFERLIGWLSGIENVRECIPMPRWAGRMLL